MHRLLVALLAAVDAAVAVAVGLAAILAPLTLVWVLALGGAADWGLLWPVAATVWQFGHVVPVAIELPGDYLAAAAIDPAAADFTLSLAPLAFAAFTAIFAARSGRRSSRAGAWLTGWLSGTVVFTGLAAAIALTVGIALPGGAAVATTETWQAIVHPALLFALPGLAGALATEWGEADEGVVARVRDRVEDSGGGWGIVPSALARGTAIVVVGLVGVGALVTAVALFSRGGEVVALFQAANVDAFGATVVTLAQLAYLPTLVVWAIAFVAGPGVSIGPETVIAPAGTQAGVLPGIPLLGALPESSSPWLLLLALAPVGLGVFAGWVVRSRMVARADGDRSSSEPVAPRLVVAIGIAVAAAAVTALLAHLAAGSIGPGTLEAVGPRPGDVALAVGLEVVLGAAILLLPPRRRGGRLDEEWVRETDPADTAPVSASVD